MRYRYKWVSCRTAKSSDGERDEILKNVLQSLHTPAGIYTIPEISMVGKTEAQLTRAGVSYEVGLADYREVRSGA